MQWVLPFFAGITGRVYLAARLLVGVFLRLAGGRLAATVSRAVERVAFVVVEFSVAGIGLGSVRVVLVVEEAFPFERRVGCSSVLGRTTAGEVSRSFTTLTFSIA